MPASSNDSHVFDIGPPPNPEEPVHQEKPKPARKADKSAPTTLKDASKSSMDAPKSVKTDWRQKISELKAAHRSEIQDIKNKHQSEQKLHQNELKDLEKKHKQELQVALNNAEKNYQAQLEEQRKDQRDQIRELKNELKAMIEGPIKEMVANYQKVVANGSHEQLEKLRKWFHSEFAQEIQKKAEELEKVKAAGDAQAEKLVAEIDARNRHMSFLEEKIKDISEYLPEDEQEELYEELGFEIPEAIIQEKPSKEKRKGFLARFSAIF